VKRSRGTLAVLGGTTTAADCLVALRHVAEPRHLVQGPAIVAYERAFARTVGVRHAYSFATARVGFYALLRALGVNPGDEVLLQVPTHIVIPNAIRYAGARPLYVDCRRDTYTIDLEQAERRITSRTRVLLLQHTFGMPADVEAALCLAERHGLEIVEDCVHALGSTYDSRHVGSFGRAAFFSTEETKTISTTMGGMVVTNDARVAASVREFQASCAWPSAPLVARYLVKLAVYHLLTEPRLHRSARALKRRLTGFDPLPVATTEEEQRGGRPPEYEQRLSNAQAVLGLRQLARLDANVAHRRTVAQSYEARLSQLGLNPPGRTQKADPAFLRYPVWVENRAEAIHRAAPHAVLGTWFTSVLEEAFSPAYGEYEPGSCPQAEQAAKHLVNLPTHPRVGPRAVEAITCALAEVREARA